MTQVNSLTKHQELPLFAMVSKNCERCFDTGIWLTPRNVVEVCPRVQMKEVHSEPNQASILLHRATNRLSEQKLWINPMAFDLARILCSFSSQKPCSRQQIFDHFFGDTNLNYSNQLRKFHALIEELRKIWLLPVGSRKIEPSGYWIIADLDDFKAWIDRVKSSPITQLSTIHKVARYNFPVFAKQMEIEFRSEILMEESK